MDSSTLSALVNRLVATWPTGVRGRVWSESLTDLDAMDALAAYARLRAECDRPPSVALFLRAYDDVRRAHARRNPPTPCEACDGTRWVECRDDRRHAAHCVSPSDCACRAVVPCPVCVDA